jgi:hypothetical protein
MTTETETTIDAILATAGVTYSVQYVGEKADGTRTIDEWRCAFKGAKAAHTFEYFTGIGHRTKMEDSAAGRLALVQLKNVNRNSIAWADAVKTHCKPKAPHAAGVLYCLLLDADGASNGTFDDWCAEYGYDTDSRKALGTYLACQKTATQLRELFTHEHLEAMHLALQDY